MEMKSFEEDHEKVVDNNGFLKKVVLIQAVGMLVLVLGWVTKDEVITINPPNMHEMYQITSKAASEPYQTAWSLAVAKLVGNMSREEAPFIIKQLSTMLTPDIYNGVRKALYAHVEMLQKKKITTTFTSKEVYFERESGKVFVYGDMALDSMISKKKDTLPFTFEFKVQISSYQPAIKHFDFYQGKPRAEGVNWDKKVKEKEEEKQKELTGA